VQARLLLGPAGSGKTIRCLAEARAALDNAPDGAPLLLVAPKQTTFELERRFLVDPAVPGYTRFHILSFERLAHYVLERSGGKSPALLDEEGRLMVLRSLLTAKRGELKLFRASARMNGFARQLSMTLSELQRHNLTPELLRQLAGQTSETGGLSLKLQDLATLLEDYQSWLTKRQLQDADCLLTAATATLASKPKTPTSEIVPPKSPGKSQHRINSSQLDLPFQPVENPTPPFRIGGLWVDGFAEWSPQELELLAAVVPLCDQATLTLCLDRVPGVKTSWLSSWSVAREAYDKCRKRLEAVPGVSVVDEVLTRRPAESRFAKAPALRHLEEFWAEPRAYGTSPAAVSVNASPDPEAEATFAAREILRHVRAGGRYREVSVLVRQLDGYKDALQRVFSRYEIPYFLDRRESVSHHPLAELTRSALRTVAFQWETEDWFAALKTGLVPAEEKDIDELETEALARGWRGAAWLTPLQMHSDSGRHADEDNERARHLEAVRQNIVVPFEKLSLALAEHQHRPTGLQLASALRDFWQILNVEDQLEKSAATDTEKHESAPAVHATVWDQMNRWLSNIELAFPREPLPLKEWFAILEAGLSNLTVGVIPPALDQVLIGAIDRSRNPDVKLVFVLGLNETIFPAAPASPLLLTDSDRAELERRGASLGTTAARQLARERYHAYIAFTRAREKLVVTYALQDANGSQLNPSPFLSQLQQLFPELQVQTCPADNDQQDCEHVSELIVPLLKAQALAANTVPAEKTHEAAALQSVAAFPELAKVFAQIKQFNRPASEDSLAPDLAAQIYGPVLKTSVSRIEQFAACSFRFFVNSGLRAQERKLFELDVKEQGSFQHDVLARFHDELRAEHKRWRDITPVEARQRIASIAHALMASYRAGLLQASVQTRFLAKVLTRSLQDFIETLISWMRDQYRFDPAKVELPFGDGTFPAWTIPLAGGQSLQLEGRIDRVDLCPSENPDQAWCVVVDYKSSHKQLDSLMIEHGLQLQLAAYLNVLRRWPEPKALFGVQQLIPAGVFYVNLRGKYGRDHNRSQALANREAARKLAYRHLGRFDTATLNLLDSRPDAAGGDQFNYRKKKDGELHKRSREALDTAEFEALLDSVEANLKRMGEEIFTGVARVHPFRKGTFTACTYCEYRPICRFDPWTQSYRVLKPKEENSL
jgi:ATP-dependent helicase/nuclease subunit B